MQDIQSECAWPSVGNDKPNTPVDQCPITNRMSQPGVADAKPVDDAIIMHLCIVCKTQACILLYSCIGEYQSVRLLKLAVKISAPDFFQHNAQPVQKFQWARMTSWTLTLLTHAPHEMFSQSLKWFLFWTNGLNGTNRLKTWMDDIVLYTGNASLYS